MRFLGQNLELVTEAKAIPPVSVKALHLNQTINGVNQEVPFQVEDWTSGYSIPLGLTNNSTVFGSSQMVVFLFDNSVSEFTLWWNGSDEAVQTPLAYTNQYFTDNIGTRTLNNGRLSITFSSSGFTVTSQAGSTTSTTQLLRVNDENDNTDPELAYVIYNGVVRDIVQGEPEYSGGADGCPNMYANAVIMLPANVTYYTYQLRLMFLDSAQSRTIDDLCPIKLSTPLSSIQAQTENGTSSGFPIVTPGTGTFYNYSSSYAAHHWSQITSGTSGTGILFTETANQNLYAFDSIAGSNVGALKTDTSTKTIELLPVATGSVAFTTAFEVSWRGIVTTFAGTSPIYRDSDKGGLWIIVEYLPTISVTAQN
jgi:hypothetical protein